MYSALRSAVANGLPAAGHSRNSSAPAAIIFFDKYWVEIGTKSSLKDLLEPITGVKVEHLFESHGASVAEKMSWAAIRETTRVEDQAYGLMGLFQVNMPPLY